VAAIADRYNAELPVRDVARLCWSTMQGLVELQSKFTSLDARLTRSPMSLNDNVDRFTDLIISGLLHRPCSPHGS